jgi:hypothetical protein
MAAKRGSGFTQQEVDSLLELLDEKLPLAKDEWDYVASRHMDRYPNTERTVDSLKRKFASLHRKKIPTGDPLIPNDVKFAKRIRIKMTERADLGDGIDDDSVNTFEDDDLEDESSTSVTATTSTIGSVTPSTSGESGATSDACVVTAPPRPLVLKRQKVETKSDSDTEFMNLFRMSILHEKERRDDELRQRELDRQIERERREEDRRERDAERAMEKERRDEDRKTNSEFMKMMMMMLAKRDN